MNPHIAISHIFAQSQWHDEAFLIGNREALTQIRDALNDLLKEEAPKAQQKVTLTTSDGEGYELFCILLDENWQSPVWQSLELPYTDEVAKICSNFDKNLTPFNLLEE